MENGYENLALSKHPSLSCLISIKFDSWTQIEYFPTSFYFLLNHPVEIILGKLWEKKTVRSFGREPLVNEITFVELASLTAIVLSGSWRWYLTPNEHFEITSGCCILHFLDPIPKVEVLVVIRFALYLQKWTITSWLPVYAKNYFLQLVKTRLPHSSTKVWSSKLSNSKK